jgi:hypothetical protein
LQGSPCKPLQKIPLQKFCLVTFVMHI